MISLLTNSYFNYLYALQRVKHSLSSVKGVIQIYFKRTLRFLKIGKDFYRMLLEVTLRGNNYNFVNWITEQNNLTVLLEWLADYPIWNAALIIATACCRTHHNFSAIYQSHTHGQQLQDWDFSTQETTI